MVLVLWVLGSAQQDPYIKASLELQGAVDHGGQLFRINCAGCHGLAGQGLVGPQLQGVSKQLKDPVLVHQIISGETPPCLALRWNRNRWPTCWPTCTPSAEPLP